MESVYIEQRSARGTRAAAAGLEWIETCLGQDNSCS